LTPPRRDAVAVWIVGAVSLVAVIGLVLVGGGGQATTTTTGTTSGGSPSKAVPSSSAASHVDVAQLLPPPGGIATAVPPDEFLPPGTRRWVVRGGYAPVFAFYQATLPSLGLHFSAHPATITDTDGNQLGGFWTILDGDDQPVAELLIDTSPTEDGAIQVDLRPQ